MARKAKDIRFVHKQLTFITVRFRQDGLHYWVGAPEGHYLRNPHRHEFHFTVWLEVFHDDCEVEPLALREELRGYMREILGGQAVLHSCERLAELIVGYLRDNYLGRAIRVWVEEDGENGAYKERGKAIPVL